METHSGVREGVLDWEAVAALLAESDARPLMVFDRWANIRLCNPALQELLGRSRGEVVGRRWTELCSPGGDGGGGDCLLASVLRGAVRKLRCEVSTPEGRHLRVSLELSLFGASDSVGVLAVVVNVTRLESPVAEVPGVSRHYIIRSRLHEFGTIRSASTHGTSEPGLEGQRCFQVLHQRASPCEGCPVLVGSQQGWPRTAVFRCPGQQHPFQIVTAEPVDEDHVRLSVQSLSDGIFRQLVHAKVEALAVAAGLSERERAVFEQLVAGRELREVAELLDISVRTVKFHQANVFRKLEVDTRASLLKLIL